MNRQNLINRLVARKVQVTAAGKAFCLAQKIGCVPCFAAREGTPRSAPTNARS